MTLGALLAVAAGLAAESRAALAQPAGGTTVAAVLRDYNKQCWADHCNTELSACMQYDTGCNDHFFCRTRFTGQILATDDMQRCFGDTRWADLTDRELGVFACAAENGCVARSHPSLSFLEEEMKRRPAWASSLLEEEIEGTLDLGERERGTVFSVLNLRAALQAAKNQLAQITWANAKTDLEAAASRMAKLSTIQSPTTEDVVSYAAVERRFRELKTALGAQLRDMDLRMKEVPLDLAAIAKLPTAKAIAPFAAELHDVLDRIKDARTIKTSRARRDAAKKLVDDAMSAISFERHAKVGVDADGHLRQR